jgi:hypothetical protein
VKVVNIVVQVDAEASEEEKDCVDSDAEAEEEDGNDDNDSQPQVMKSIGVQIVCEDVELLNVGLVECYVLRSTVC